MRTIKFWITAALALTIQESKAQGFLWAKQIGSTGSDVVKSVAKDNAGDIYSTGYFSNTAILAPGNASFAITSSGGQDLFVSKMDPNGNPLWTATFTGSANSDQVGNSIATDFMGVVVTGYFTGTVDFDPGPAVFNLTSAGNRDIFILKLDPTGAFTWAQQIGSTGIDEATSLYVDMAANVYCTGRFSGTVNFDFNQGGALNLTSSGGTDAFVMKMAGFGNGLFLWAKTIGGPLDDVGNAIAFSSVNNVWEITYTGAFEGTVDFDPGAAAFPMTSAGLKDAYVSKLDMNGNFVWAKRFGSTGNDVGMGITADITGNLYSTGSFNGTVDFDPGAATTAVTSSGPLNAYISNLDGTGNFVWAVKLAALNNSEGRSVSLDGNGSLFSTGSFDQTCDFDPGAATSNLTSAGGTDVYISKLNATTGAFSWAGRMGGNADDDGSCILSDANGNVYTTGLFRNISDFDPSAVNFNLTAGGVPEDGFIQKLGGCVSNMSVNNGAICAGGSFSITVTGVATYTIQGGNAQVSPTVTTTYTVAGTSAAGCPAQASVQVSVNAMPVIAVNSGSVCNGASFTINPTGATSYTIQGGNAVVNPAVSTTYSVIGANGGCVAQPVTSTVTVSSFTMSASSNTAICGGVQVILSANGTSATGYTWTSPGGTLISPTLAVSPSVPTTYTVVGKNASNCAVTKTVSVNVGQTPIIMAQANPLIVCERKPITLSATGANSYTWASTTGSLTSALNIVSHTLAATYVYTVTGLNPSGCSSTATISVRVDKCTITNELQNENLSSVSIYPNPSNGAFTIKANPSTRVYVMDVFGKLLSQEVVSESGELSVKDFARGIYFVTSEENGLRFNKKIVVE